MTSHHTRPTPVMIHRILDTSSAIRNELDILDDSGSEHRFGSEVSSLSYIVVLIAYNIK